MLRAKLRNHHVTRIALLASTVIAQPALAQASQKQTTQAQTDAASGRAQAPVTNSEIIVTAQFRSQKLQDTPLAITALDAQLLQARNLNKLSDIGEQAPNVVIKPAGSAYGPATQIFIRGIGQADTNFALEPGVGVYIDDVYYSTVFGSVFDLVDVDRIEILRGPQGTLAGKNSIGGSLKLFSRKPDNEMSGSIEANLGSFDRKGIRGSLNLPIIEDKLAVRLAGVARYSDGYVTSYDYGCLNPGSGVPSVRTSRSCKIGSEGGQEYYGLRGSLRWTPSSDVSVTLTGDVSNDKSEPAASVVTHIESRGRSFLSGTPFDSRFVTAGTYRNYATYDNSGGNYVTRTGQVLTLPAGGISLQRNNDLVDWGLSGVVDWTITDGLSLKSITAYREYHGIFNNDADETPFGMQLVSNDFRHRQFSQELRLSGASFDRHLEWTVGGFYFKSRDITGGRVFFPSNFDTLLYDPAHSRSQSVFAHGTLHVTDRLNVTAGIRYSNERKTYTFNREDPATGAPPPALAAIDGVTGEAKNKRVDYKINADYHLNDDVMVYAQWSTGFRSGGINPRPFYSNQVVSFDPEALDAYELGVKSELFDRALTLNASVFLNKYRNILIQNRNPYVNPNIPIDENPLSPTYNPSAGTAPAYVIANGGTADLKGFEIETRIKPLAGLDIDASLSYLDFKYTSISAAAASGGITLDSRREFMPKWKWNIGVQYEFDLGDHGSLTPRFDVLFQDDIYTGSVSSEFNSISDYTLANAQLTWKSPARDIDVSLAVSNLFNKYYYLNKFETVAASGTALGQPGRPREWQLVVRHRF